MVLLASITVKPSKAGVDNTGSTTRPPSKKRRTKFTRTNRRANALVKVDFYNHIGHFAAAAEVFCKALFFGGVTRRFPTLKFAFLECGVGWACSLYHDLIGHWEKRNLRAVREHLDPARVDRALFVDLVKRYGDARALARIDEIEARDSLFIARYPERAEDLDEWAACRIDSVDDIRDLFVPNFYFGCEAGDRTARWAFDHRLNPGGARLKAIFSSDVGHWDVTDCRAVLAEADELVANGFLSRDDFRSFVFEYPLELHAGMNPAFFAGTAIEDAVAQALARRERRVG
ncbi:MAG: hypothetical protein FJX61_08155 [Alphaproteobacteria bacterium]|nr:hypothetical protein [Alphaproteobacteria bacterium]